jgi:hypothetical protein
VLLLSNRATASVYQLLRASHFAITATFLDYVPSSNNLTRNSIRREMGIFQYREEYSESLRKKRVSLIKD